MNDQPTQRAFWKSTGSSDGFLGIKFEGWTGIITILGLVAAGAFALLTFGPALLAALSMAIALTSKLIVLGSLCVVAFLGFMVVTNPRVHTLVSYFFKSAMRKVTQAFVEIDPIGIMRSFVSDLKARKNVMAENIRQLNGQKTTVQEKVNDNKRLAEDALKMAAVAKQKGNAALMTVNSKQHGRLTEYTVRLEDVLAKMELLLKMLRKYYEAADTVIQDLTNEVNIQEDQRKMMFAAHGAMTAAREIIAGEGDKRELFDLAMESVKDSYGQKLGEIEDFMQMSQSFIDGMDLKNGVFEADALKKIADWESNVDSLLLGDSKRQILESHGTQAIPVFNANMQSAGSSDYAKLFNGR